MGRSRTRYYSYVFKGRLSLSLAHIEMARALQHAVLRLALIGIPADVRDRIFEPFFMTKEIGLGSGLGLSAALGIVEQSGGTIVVQSDPGHGSSFVVELPELRGSRRAST